MSSLDPRLPAAVATASTATATFSSRRAAMLCRLALFLLTIVLYARAVKFDFISFDDPVLIYDNPRLTPPTISSVGYYWTHRGLELFIPLTYSVWAMVATISHAKASVQLVPWGFHAINIVTHLASVLIAFELLQRLLTHAFAAAVGAAVFAAHPMQVEPVVWATGLRDVLAGAGALLAIYLYLRARTRSQSALKSMAALIVYVLAMLAKPSAVSALLIAAVLEWHFYRRAAASVALRLIPWALAAGVVLLITRYVQTAGDVPNTPLYLRPMIALDALAFYLGKLIWPFSLVPAYPHRPADIVANGWIEWTWIVPVAVAAIVFRSRQRTLATAGMVFLAGLAPTLGFVSFVFQRHSTVADRYAYLAMLGPAIAVGWAVKRSNLSGRAIAVVCVLALAARCADQVSEWRDSLTLSTASVAQCPESPMLHVNHGVALASLGRIEQADAEFVRALRLDSSDQSARYNHQRAQSILNRQSSGRIDVP